LLHEKHGGCRFTDPNCARDRSPLGPKRHRRFGSREPGARAYPRGRHNTGSSSAFLRLSANVGGCRPGNAIRMLQGESISHGCPPIPARAADATCLRTAAVNLTAVSTNRFAFRSRLHRLQASEETTAT
jgi:hypothetical protein